MNKIAIFIILFAAVFACDPVIPEEEVILESSLDDYIEVIKCLLSNEPLIKDVSDLIAAIKAQDFTQFFAIAMRLYTDGKAALTECTKGEGEIELERGFVCNASCRISGKSAKECKKICG